MQDEKPCGLCFRCEYRAAYLEKGHGPRCECGSIEKTVVGCYMYLPVIPITVAKREGDQRPILSGTMISARVERTGTADHYKLNIDMNEPNITMYWAPETDHVDRHEEEC